MGKTMKKIFCFVFMLAFLLSLASCTSGNKNTSTKTNTVTTTPGTSTIITTPSSTTTTTQVIVPSVDYYTVEFDVLGHGTKPFTQVVDKGGYATLPKAPTEDGWIFEGWYKDAACQEEFIFAAEVITANIVLYAKWTEFRGVTLPTNYTPTIYLAGDSTVQTYADTQYIAGWGQYLNLFFDEEVKVVNAARGGRSSRSFINEDRLFTASGAKYSFSENGGKSIEETIQAGDFLFVQFGHNDDSTKGYATMPDRMVPLGEPDENGIYPVTAPTEMKATTYLPEEYTSQATEKEISTMQAEIAKYGDTYYAYGDGTYKWYLKQYIDLARSKGATPVLLTPVARVSFNADGTLKSGPGLHGDDFAYVKAVRQLAEEENCLLIDTFEATKNMIETATKSYADFLMAIVPNTLDNGPWPSGYDNAYNNAEAGYQKMEATHYNKYGAYLTAACIAERILIAHNEGVIKGSQKQEYFNFASRILTTPYSYVDPSNRISISKIDELEGLLTLINPTNPNRVYVQPQEAIKAIEELASKGDISSINKDNYLEWMEYCQTARAVYESLNFDYRDDVTNYSILESYEEACLKARPKPIKTVVLSANDFVDAQTPITVDDHTFSFDSNIVSYSKKAAGFVYNDVAYEATTNSIRLAGNAKITGDQTKFIEFTTTGACEITIVASGGGDTTRYIQMANANKVVVASFDVEPSQTVSTVEITEGGTYRIGSKGSNIDVYYIIIEYYA